MDSPYNGLEYVPEDPDKVGWVDNVESFQIFLVPVNETK